MSKLENNRRLEIICPACGGNGGETEMGKFYPCDECNGSGYKPTKNGKAILDLMRHNIKRLVDKELSA